jgi:hypothetical protein
MRGNYGIIENEFALKIVHEYRLFVKDTLEKINETRRATMVSLKKLLKLQDGDVIEIEKDGVVRVIPAQEVQDGE